MNWKGLHGGFKGPGLLYFLNWVVGAQVCLFYYCLQILVYFI